MGNALFLCALVASTWHAQPQTSATAPEGAAEQHIARRLSSRPERSPDIVVVGPRSQRGSAMGTAPPLRIIEVPEIQAYGANDIGELVQALEPQTRSNGTGAGRQIVLLNGNRIGDFSDISGLPVEAIERIDILPPETALAYGYPVGSRVLNIVLREDFRSSTIDNSAAAATEGGRDSFGSTAAYTRIRRNGRLNLDVSLAHDGALYEAERDIIAPARRTLLPGTTDISVGGAVSDTLFPRVDGTLSARLTRGESDSRLGVSGAGEPLDRHARSLAARLSFGLRGDFGLWRWSAIGSAERSNHIFLDYSGRSPVGQVRYHDGRGSITFSLSGPIAHLPAGDLLGTATVSDDLTGFAATQPGPQAGWASMTRNSLAGSGSIDVPLLSRARRSPIGDLAVGLNATLMNVTGFGLLRTVGASLRWSPLSALSLTASYLDEDGIPSLQQLGEPVIQSPGILVYDPTRGETVEVVRLDGGNSSLRQNNRRERKLEITLRPPHISNLLISANYSEVNSRDPIATFPIVSPALEQAFPDRFHRDGTGRLILIDSRAITVAGARFRGVRWGFQYAVRGQDGRRRPTQLQMSVFHTWRFQNLIRTSLQGPTLDLLNGSSIGSRGGLPRHFVEAQATWLTALIGARIDVTWQTATIVRLSGPGTTSDMDLLFEAYPQVGLRVFTNLGQVRWLAGAPSIVRSGRLTLEVSNVLDNRLTVHDRRGLTPLGYQPAYLDPLGRSIRLRFRTTF